MKIIKSKENTTYKMALKLTKKKYRDETGLYLLEGVKPLQDALTTEIPIKNVLLAEGSNIKIDAPVEKSIVLDRRLFESISDTETSQGVIAIAAKKTYDAAAFSRVTAQGNIVLLDRLQDPGNIGTIIRTAEAAGYSGIIMVKGTGDPYSPKVVRAAAGSLLRMPLIIAEDDKEAVNMVKTMGKRLVVTELDACHDCFEADLSGKIALVIGNEGQGVGEGFMKSADQKVRIPMEGSIESLNAAVAAGILMYQSRKIK